VQFLTLFIITELYGSIEDYRTSSNEWNYCSYTYGYGFPGSCGVSHSANYQSSQFPLTCSSPNTSQKSEVYWFLYDPTKLAGKYQPDWSPTEPATGLPFLFSSAEDIQLEHIVISGAGHDGAYSLTIERPSSIPYKDISILNGLGNGISVTGEGSFQLENISIKSDTSSVGNGIFISNKANVTINGLFVSTKHNGRAVYAYGNQVSLSLINSRFKPLNSDQHAVFVDGIETMYIDTFIQEFAIDSALYSIYMSRVKQFASIKNGIIECNRGDMIYSTIGPPTIIVENVTMVGNALNGIQRVLFLSGSKNVVVSKNTINNIETSNDLLAIDADPHSIITVTGNTVTNVKAQSNIWKISGGLNSTILFSNNTLDTCQMTLNQASSSGVSFNAPMIEMMGNKFMHVQGYTVIGIGNNLKNLNLTRNLIANATVEFYIKTRLLYTDIADGIVRIGPNYWSTSSFEVLEKKTYDSTYDADLATIKFDSIFVDPEMMQTIPSPPTESVLDLVKMTLSGIISEDIVVTVPRGLYYSPGSIILQHPKAQLVLEAGTRIMFAEHSSIRVNQGVLKVLGEENNHVLLAPTSELAPEFGDSSIVSTPYFDGISFGAYSNGTILGGESTYVDGSILRHCNVKLGGYFRRSSSVSMDQVSVMLDHVVVEGEWGRSVTGVYFRNPKHPVVLRHVSVRNSGGIGIQIYNIQNTTQIEDVDVHNSRGNGIKVDYAQSIAMNGVEIHNASSTGIVVAHANGAINFAKLNVQGCKYYALNVHTSPSTRIDDSIFYDNPLQISVQGGFSLFLLLSIRFVLGSLVV
jgi:hypothetical protein